MARRRWPGWLLLGVALVVGGLAWFTAWGTFQPGFGFETFTVPAAVVGTVAACTLAIAAALLGRPLVLGRICIGAAALFAVVAYQLSQDIPGAPGTDPGFAELYRSRLQALWLAAFTAVSLAVIGGLCLWPRRGGRAAVSTGVSHRPG